MHIMAAYLCQASKFLVKLLFECLFHHCCEEVSCWLIIIGVSSVIRQTVTSFGEISCIEPPCKADLSCESARCRRSP